MTSNEVILVGRTLQSSNLFIRDLEPIQKFLVKNGLI